MIFLSKGYLVVDKRIYNDIELKKRLKRKILLIIRTYVLYNYYIATLGKMLNRNSNNQCMVSLTFPFNWPLKLGGVENARRSRIWLTRIYY